MTLNLEDFTVDQDTNGDLVVTYTPTSTVIERIDSGDEEKILEVATQISTLKDATSGNQVYDSPNEELTADVNNTSVSTGEENGVISPEPGDLQTALTKAGDRAESASNPDVFEPSRKKVQIVRLRGDRIYTPSSTLSVPANVWIDFNGAYLSPTGDFDVFHLAENTILINPLVGTEGQTFTSTVYYYNADNFSSDYGLYKTQTGIIGGFSQGTQGSGVLCEIRGTSNNDIYDLRINHKSTGFDIPYRLNADGGFVNGCTIRASAHQYGTYMVEQVGSSGSSANRFWMEGQAGGETAVWRLGGPSEKFRNRFIGNVFDVTGDHCLVDSGASNLLSLPLQNSTVSLTNNTTSDNYYNNWMEGPLTF